MTRKLRVGFVSVQDASDVNGFSGSTYQMLSHLRETGVHVEIYSPLRQSIKNLLAPLKALSRLRGKNLTLDHYPLVAESYARQIRRFIRERPVDVIVSNSSIPVSALSCSQPILFWTDAVFHDMHDYYGGTFSNLSASAVNRAKRQEESALAVSAFAVYGCNWAARTARQLTDAGKVKVLTFGPNLPIEHSAANVRAWAGERRQKRPGSCKLLFVGVDWVRKGGAIAVETAKILNESGLPTSLTIVGSDPQQDVPDYVEKLGFISKSTPEGRARFGTLLREADFFILPTQAEATGIVFCEASAFGLPSLSYDTGGVSDYIRTGENGVCLPVGTQAIGFAREIQNMLQDQERYESICLSAFHAYESRLNWGASARALVELCHLALENKS